MDMINSILDNIDDLLVILNSDRKIVLHNKEADRLYRSISNASFRHGDDFLECLIPERKKIVGEILDQIGEDKKPFKTFAEYKTITGSKLFLDLNYIPVLNDSGQISHIHVIGMDVTPQKIFEQKMTSLVGEVTNLIDNVNVIIASTDSRGYITQWNNRCAELFGYEKNEVFARKIDFLLDKRHHAAHDALFRRALRNEEPENVELPFKTRDGNEVIVMITATPRLSADGAVTGVTFAGQDITELTRYRTSLERTVEERTIALKDALRKEEEALEIKSKFVAIASHEFRTPLSAIQHATNQIKSNHSQLSKDELCEKLDYIEKHRVHMTHLLDDVLTYGKSEPGKIKLFITTLLLDDFIIGITEDVGHSTGNTHTIKVVKTNMPDEISTDEKLFRNVITNLLSNAVKFSPNHTHVNLTVSGVDNRVKFEVRDEGIGIPAEEIEKIFDPFLRGKGVHSIPGTGLGLSIVKKSVALLNGSITVSSQPGKGSAFTVTIPKYLSQTHE